MAGARLEISIKDGGLGQALERALSQLGDLRPVLEASAGVIETNINDRFETGRGPGGIPWPPSNRIRSEAVPSGKQRRSYGPLRPEGKTLIQSGSLRESIGHEVREKEVVVGTTRPGPGDSHRYAAVHQFGATIVPRTAAALVFTGADGGLVFAQSVTIPARPFIGFDDQDVADLTDLWEDAMKEPFDGH